MKVISSIITLFFFATASLFAQGSTATAIMQVQVEIIGGAQFEQQMVDAGAEQLEQLTRGEAVTLGSFTITVPDGADYSIHMDREVEMTGDQTWRMETLAEHRVDGQTNRFEVQGKTSEGAGELYAGDYEGRQVAVLEFH